jgi:hypothetical protein
MGQMGKSCSQLRNLGDFGCFPRFSEPINIPVEVKWLTSGHRGDDGCHAHLVRLKKWVGDGGERHSEAPRSIMKMMILIISLSLYYHHLQSLNSDVKNDVTNDVWNDVKNDVSKLKMWPSVCIKDVPLQHLWEHHQWSFPLATSLARTHASVVAHPIGLKDRQQLQTPLPLSMLPQSHLASGRLCMGWMGTSRL